MPSDEALGPQVATAAIKNFFTETHEDGAKVVNASELLSIKQDTIGACCTGPGPVEPCA